MALQEIINEKLNRLLSVPDGFLTKLETSQKEAFSEVLALLNSLTVRGGSFVPTADNLKKAVEITATLKEVMNSTSFPLVVADFIGQFDIQGELNNRYFQEIIEDFILSDFSKEVLLTSKRRAIDLLVDGVGTQFANPVGSAIEKAVINNSSFSETVTMLQQIILGDEEREAQLYRYSELIARDTYAVADRSYTNSVAESLGIEFYWYSAGVVPGSRKFCIEREDRYFHKSEIEAWGEGERTGDFDYPEDGTWQGRNPATDSSTIFSYLGGYNCLHSPLPVSVFAVPKDDLQRAVDLGFYTPSRFVIEDKDLKVN